MIDINNSDDSNILDIDEETNFQNSVIKINGFNNIINIKKSKHPIKNLNIELRGDCNKITIEKTCKVINGLHIQSIRSGNSSLIINENFSCGGCDIKMNDGYEKLYIGRDCLFSWGVKIRTSDAHAVIDLATGNAINLPSDIHIGSHVWIGEDVKILKGAYVPDNCVIGAFSLVTKGFTKRDKHSILAGFPAKIIKSNIDWDRRRADEFNNNIRILDYLKQETVKDNSVTLKIRNINKINHWETIAILQNITLNSNTILEICYTYEQDLDDIKFQILLWGSNVNTYFWNEINFPNQDNKKGVVLIDFSSLKKVGVMTYKDVQYVEIRGKRIKK